MCYVPLNSGLVRAARHNPHQGRIELYCMIEETPGTIDSPADLPVRTIRYYLETDKRIRGVPVLQETTP